VAFGISAQELGDRALLALEIRNILAARPPFAGWRSIPRPKRPPGNRIQPGLSPYATVRPGGSGSRRGTDPFGPGRPDRRRCLVGRNPITINGATAGAVVLALSQEGAQRMAAASVNNSCRPGRRGWRSSRFGVLLERNINRPIRALLETMTAVERGDLSATPTLQGRTRWAACSRLGADAPPHSGEPQRERAPSCPDPPVQPGSSAQVAEATRELVERNEALRSANELLFDLQRQLGRAQRLATVGHLTARIAMRSARHSTRSPFICNYWSEVRG